MATHRRLFVWVIGCLLALPSAAQAAQSVSEFPITTADSAPSEVTAGADGKLWFTETGSNKIGRMSTGGVVTEWPTPSGSASGPDGNMWFTEQGNGGAIGTIDLGTQAITEYSTGLSANSSPADIVAASDGFLYFTETGADKIAKISDKGGPQLIGLHVPARPDAELEPALR